MGELKITVDEARLERVGTAVVNTEFQVWARAIYWGPVAEFKGEAGVDWGSHGRVPIAHAKAFHAALGKAIEIAEGYQRELDNA